MLGSKPLIIFQGAAFDNDEVLKRAKSLLLDLFSGPKAEQVLLSGLDQAIVVSTLDGRESVNLRLVESGQKGG